MEKIFLYTLSVDKQTPLIFKGWVLNDNTDYLTVYVKEMIDQGSFLTIWPGRSYNFDKSYLEIKDK